VARLDETVVRVSMKILTRFFQPNQALPSGPAQNLVNWPKPSRSSGTSFHPSILAPTMFAIWVGENPLCRSVLFDFTLLCSRTLNSTGVSANCGGT
jgi:hypothetical protein